MSEAIEQESTELVTLPAKESALAVYSNVGGLDPLIEQIRAKVIGTVYDMATAKGRDECRSDAAKIAKSKTAIERLGKELSAQYKEIPKKIDAERKRAFDALEALQKEVRQPLTDWEEAEAARVALHRADIEGLESQAVVGDLDAAGIGKRIQFVESVAIDSSWDEFETEAHRVKEHTLKCLRETMANREKHEAEQAELARLRAESEARAKRDEEERIAREAAEAATKAAEAKARAESEASARREADAKAAQAKAEQDAKDASERQRRAEEQAEAERLASIERARQSAEAARLAEVKRQADEAARIEAEAKAREADRSHKSKILGAAKEGLMAAGITEDQARAAVKLIVAGSVPNVRIHF